MTGNSGASKKFKKKKEVFVLELTVILTQLTGEDDR